MNKIRVLGLIVATCLMQLQHARADDYENGYDSGRHQYYGGKPDNNSSADYYQGYQRGQAQHQQQQQRFNNNEE